MCNQGQGSSATKVRHQSKVRQNWKQGQSSVCEGPSLGPGLWPGQGSVRIGL